MTAVDAGGNITSTTVSIQVFDTPHCGVKKAGIPAIFVRKSTEIRMQGRPTLTNRWRWDGGYTLAGMVTLRRRGQVLIVPAGKNLEQMLRNVGILPDTVIVVQDGKIVPPDYRPKDGEEFELIDVISGG